MADKKWFGKGIYDKDDKPVKVLNIIICIMILLIIFVIVFSKLN